MYNTRMLHGRAKSKDNGKWYEGVPCVTQYECNREAGQKIKFLRLPNKKLVEIYPKTFTLWTGLKDMQGTKIFDGDIVEKRNQYIRLVEYDMSKAAYVTRIKHYDEDLRKTEYLAKDADDGMLYDVLVIGNVFDDKGLLR